MAIELLAPAGSLHTALSAFEAGADAVYCGMTEFSARAAAENFSVADLRRLKTFASAHGKRIYVALNTVICEEEYPRMRQLIATLGLCGVDALIVQDPGLFHLLRCEFPHFAVHISTQMAVHNASGARLMADLGAKRVVLARELTLAEITALRTECPELQLEVFCHGALCYSFSGLCLASGLMLGRSANRGRCAQVCRTYFHRAGSGGCGYYFSMNDLALHERIRDLERLGVAALKIEGRMKDAGYVTAVVKLYRAILDRTLAAASLDPLKSSSSLSFSRTPTLGYFNDARGEHLLECRYPGHMGLAAGRIIENNPPWLTLTCCIDLQLHDKLMFLAASPSSMGERSADAGGRILRMRSLNRRPLSACRADETIQVTISGSLPPGKGQWLVFLVKRETSQQPMISRDLKKFPLVTNPIALKIEISRNSVSLSAAPFTGSREVQVTCAAEPQESDGSLDALPAHLSHLFAASGTSFFRVATVNVVNRSGRERPFLSPSFWKLAKRTFYETLDQVVQNTLESSAQGPSFRAPSGPEALCLAASGLDLASWGPALADRRSLNPENRVYHRRLPFLMPSTKLACTTLGKLGPWHVVPLLPILFETESYFEHIAAWVATHGDEQFLVGLNNIGHVTPCAQKLAGLKNCSFFLDAYLYVASLATVQFFARHLPRIAFFYQWAEQQEIRLPGAIAIADRTCLPYFLSRCCWRRHIMPPQGFCKNDCSADSQTSLTNGGRTFDLLTLDCLSFLMERTEGQTI